MTFMYISNINSILKIHFARYTNRKINTRPVFCVIGIHFLYESDNLNYIFLEYLSGWFFFSILFCFIKSLNLFTLNYTELQITKLGIGKDPINRNSAVDSTVFLGDYHSFHKSFLGNGSNSTSKPKDFIL